jgi:VWFA-related protein
MKQRPTLAAAAALLALAAFPLSARAQAPAETFVERVDVNVVNVEVFVTDRQGNPITGLTADDFRLFVDGGEVPISNFYAEVAGDPARRTAPPARPATGPRASEEAMVVPAETPPEQVLYMTVLVDNANIRPVHRKRVFGALRELLAGGLPTEARVSIASLGVGQTLTIHSDYLSNRAALGKILDELEAAPAANVGAEIQQRQILSELTRGAGGRGLGLGQDAALLARIRAFSQEEYNRGLVSLDALSRFVASLGGVPGRRALMYVADGIPVRPGEDLFYTWASATSGAGNSSDTQLGDVTQYRREIGEFDLTRQFDQLAEMANASRVTVYTLDAAGSHTDFVRGAVTEGRVPSDALSAFEANYRDPQELVAQATGGRRLAATTRLAAELEEVTRDFVTFYSLGFEADAADEPQRHKIKVELADGKGRIVRYRQAVVAKPEEMEIAERAIATLLYGTGSNPLDVSVSTGEPELRNDGAAVLPLKVRVPLSRIGLLPNGDVHTGRLMIYVSTKDEAGQPRPVQKLPFHIQVPADKLEQALGQQAEYTLPLVVRPGDQQVVLGVSDALSTGVSTVRLDLGTLVDLRSPKG